MTEQSTLMCLRPIPRTGPDALWKREGRDRDRERDALRCGCNGPECRDRELMGPQRGRN